MLDKNTLPAAFNDSICTGSVVSHLIDARS